VPKIKAYHRTAEGKIEEHFLEEIDATFATQMHPSEWSLTGKFLPVDDPVSAQRRLLMSPTFEGAVERAKERGIG
jgi:hypothetical protein